MLVTNLAVPKPDDTDGIPSVTDSNLEESTSFEQRTSVVVSRVCGVSCYGQSFQAPPAG